MGQDSTDTWAKTAQAWLTAGRLLGIRITAPFTLRVGAQSVDCIAFLPDFGRDRGTVIGGVAGPAFQTDAVLWQCAKAAGVYCSFVNMTLYSEYSEARFKEALEDWGYYGPESLRPEWLTRQGSETDDPPEQS